MWPWVLLGAVCAIGIIVLALRSRSAGGGVPSICGTTWVGRDSDGDLYEYRFLEEGVLEWVSASGTWQDGTWRQEEATVYMEMNRRYSERQGTIVGNRMKGNGWNVKGHKWTWTAEKQ